MWVPPCDAGVKPIPPRPASRPECIRISASSATETSTWKTAATGSMRGRVAQSLRGSTGGGEDRVDEARRDRVLRDVALGAGPAGAVDVLGRVRARQHQD